MIIPDINLLIYAYNSADRDHDKAAAWWEQTLNGDTPIGLPWMVAGGFIRLLTHPRILVSPATVGNATDIVKDWLARPHVTPISPGGKFPQVFFNLLNDLGTAGNLTSDAHLAALAVENQATLFSADTDFHRFPGLRWRNPLTA